LFFEGFPTSIASALISFDDVVRAEAGIDVFGDADCSLSRRVRVRVRWLGRGDGAGDYYPESRLPG